MAETITKRNMESIAAEYGWTYDAESETLRIEGEEYDVPWTKAGHISPRAKLWMVMRDASREFARDYPKTTKAAKSRQPTVFDAEYWMDYSPEELERIKEAIEGVDEARREVGRSEILQRMEDLGLTVDDLQKQK